MNSIQKLLTCIITCLAITNANAYSNEELYYTNETLNAYQTVINCVSASNKVEKNDARAMMADHLRNLVKQRNAIDKVKYEIDRFKDSKIDSVKASSALITVSLSMLSINLQNTITLTEQMLNMSDSDFIKSAGTFTKKTAELGEAINDGWELYAKSSISVTYTLIDGFNTNIKNADLDKKLNRLKITRSEINELKKTIETKFSRELKSDAKKLGYYQMPPVFIYEFLNDKWLASNEK